MKLQEIKSQGYISGIEVGTLIRTHLMLSSGRFATQIYNRYFREIKKSVQSISLGEGHGTRHFYNKVQVMNYINKQRKSLV